jgi:N-acetylmuramoyl-L-alanine amidase
MIKACIASVAFFCLLTAVPIKAFDWETTTSRGREYVTLHSFCTFYGFAYQAPSGNDRFVSRSPGHSISLKIGNSDIYLDGVHYVLSFPIEGGDRDWLVSRMDVIKLFDPILRPTEVSGRHTIRGVVIDAGHGGSDNGATSRLGAEKDYTLKTAFMLEGILRRAGLKTVLTRRTDVFIDLYERAHIASLYPDYCFVSIHFNSATPEARGLETYCLSPRGAASTSSAYLTRSDIQKLLGNDDDAQNILLASMVHSEIIKLNPGDGTADRGVKRARFVVIKQNVLPAILVEGGFVSNRMESARVNRTDYQQSLAQAIARGVIRFVNVMGDRNLSLPSGSSDNAPAPTPVPVVTPAPDGLAKDSPPTKGKATPPSSSGSKSVTAPKTPPPSANAPAPSTNAAPTTTNSKKKKSKKTSPAPSTNAATATPELSQPPVTRLTPTPSPTPTPTTVPTAPSPTPEVTKPAGTIPSGPLNLKEPAAPTPAPGAEKAPAEPDEPPTVNIYSTTPVATPPPAAGTNTPAATKPTNP